MTTNHNQDGSFDLFSELSEEERLEAGIADKAAPIVAKGSHKSSMEIKPIEQEPDEYPIERVVFYAGHRLIVPNRTLKKEEVRVWLEETFPELTKSNTELLYDEKTGHLVPILKAQKKGAKSILVQLEEPDQPMPVYFRFGHGGCVEEVRTTQTGEFTLPLFLRQDLESIGSFHPYRILPSSDVLQEIIARFQEDPDTEHLAYIVWSQDHYEVNWPDQEGTAVSVEAAGFLETEDVYTFMQIHSHGRLDAFWSGQDNRDEIRTGLYGVIGRCELPRPHAKFRFSVGGRFSSMDVSCLFQGNTERLVWSK